MTNIKDPNSHVPLIVPPKVDPKSLTFKGTLTHHIGPQLGPIAEAPRTQVSLFFISRNLTPKYLPPKLGHPYLCLQNIGPEISSTQNLDTLKSGHSDSPNSGLYFQDP